MKSGWTEAYGEPVTIRHTYRDYMNNSYHSHYFGIACDKKPHIDMVVITCSHGPYYADIDIWSNTLLTTLPIISETNPNSDIDHTLQLEWDQPKGPIQVRFVVPPGITVGFNGTRPWTLAVFGPLKQLFVGDHIQPDVLCISGVTWVEVKGERYNGATYITNVEYLFLDTRSKDETYHISNSQIIDSIIATRYIGPSVQLTDCSVYDSFFKIGCSDLIVDGSQKRIWQNVYIVAHDVDMEAEVNLDLVNVIFGDNPLAKVVGDRYMISHNKRSHQTPDPHMGKLVQKKRWWTGK